MMLRAGGRACESLREARAGDRDRAAGVEGETVLTVSPSPLPTVRDPCATIPPRPISSSRPRLATGNRLKLGTFANGARPHALTNSSVARRLSARNASQRPCLLWQADDERRLTSTPGVTRPWVGCPASVRRPPSAVLGALVLAVPMLLAAGPCSPFHVQSASCQQRLSRPLANGADPSLVRFSSAKPHSHRRCAPYELRAPQCARGMGDGRDHYARLSPSNLATGSRLPRRERTRRECCNAPPAVPVHDREGNYATLR
ncbi:hypothetical protein AcV5_010499 [Taiwanofungus camphoratus]|nr:hypothetical protein AcV5_010499 [Antrodia cinnamomea]